MLLLLLTSYPSSKFDSETSVNTKRRKKNQDTVTNQDTVHSYGENVIGIISTSIV